MALLEGTVDGKNYNHYTRSTTDDRIDVSKY